jgi:hypothetical protein
VKVKLLVLCKNDGISCEQRSADGKSETKIYLYHTRILNCGRQAASEDLALFACFIIRIFQLVFSTEIIFFFHNKSANSTFSYNFSAKQMDSPKELRHERFEISK